MSKKTRAGCVLRVEELVRRTHRIALAGLEMLMILRRQKRRQMMIEPPRNLWRSRVLEIDNRILIAGKVALVEERPCSMHQPVIFVRSVGVNALPMESRKKRCRASSVKTLVVIEDANPQSQLLWAKLKESRKLSIKGRADCVKAMGHKGMHRALSP